MTALGASQEDGPVLLRYVSLGAFAGLLLFLSDGISQVAPLIGALISTQYFFISALCAGVCCGVFFAVRGALPAVTTDHNFGIKAGCMAVFGFAACLLASSLQLPAILLIPCGVLFGIGIVMLGIGQGVHLCGLGDRQFLQSVLLASLVAGFIKILLLLLPAFWLGVCMILVLIASALMPLTLRSPRIAANRGTENTTSLAKGMTGRNWIFFSNLLLCLLVNTLPWTLTFSGQAIPPSLGFAAPMGTAVGSIATALLLLLARERLGDRLQTAMPVIPLVCTAIILVTWYLFVWGGGLHLFGGYETSIGAFVASIPVGFSTMLGLFILLWRFRTEVRLGLSPLFVYGIFSAFIAGLFLVFIVLQYSLVRVILSGIDSMMRVIFLVVTAIFMMRSTQRSTPMAAPPPVLPDQRIQDIGARFGLSKREIEILALLIERRSAPYIAEVEFIALSTVKTHIKHLYEKTGTHNRKELLDIIYGEDGEV